MKFKKIISILGLGLLTLTPFLSLPYINMPNSIGQNFSTNSTINKLSKNDVSHLWVTKITNTSNSSIPIFDINKLPNIYQERELECSEVTAEDVKNIIIRNQESFFGSTLNNQAFNNVLVENSLNVLNRETNVYVTFELQNIVIEKPDGTKAIGNNSFTLILNGFVIKNSFLNYPVMIAITTIIILILICFIIFFVVKHLRRANKKIRIIQNELIID